MAEGVFAGCFHVDDDWLVAVGVWVGGQFELTSVVLNHDGGDVLPVFDAIPAGPNAKESIFVYHFDV